MEAGMMALKERRMKVNMNDFEEAKKKTLFRKKSKEPEGLYLSPYLLAENTALTVIAILFVRPLSRRLFRRLHRFLPVLLLSSLLHHLLPKQLNRLKSRVSVLRRVENAVGQSDSLAIARPSLFLAVLHLFGPEVVQIVRQKCLAASRHAALDWLVDEVFLHVFTRDVLLVDDAEWSEGQRGGRDEGYAYLPRDCSARSFALGRTGAELESRVWS